MRWDLKRTGVQELASLLKGSCKRRLDWRNVQILFKGSTQGQYRSVEKVDNLLSGCMLINFTVVAGNKCTFDPAREGPVAHWSWWRQPAPELAASPVLAFTCTACTAAPGLRLGC